MFVIYFTEDYSRLHSGEHLYNREYFADQFADTITGRMPVTGERNNRVKEILSMLTRVRAII
jgi:hypothetical protein